MTTTEEARELAQNAAIAVSDANRCISLGIQPSSGTLHRALEKLLPTCRALLAERDEAQAKLTQVREWAEGNWSHESVNGAIVTVVRLADLLAILSEAADAR